LYRVKKLFAGSALNGVLASARKAVLPTPRLAPLISNLLSIRGHKMVRHSRIPLRRIASAHRQFGWLFLLAFCTAFIQSGTAHALTAARLGGAISVAGLPVTPVSGCRGGHDCAADPAEHRWEPEARPIPDVPCERAEYRPRVYAYAYRTEPEPVIRERTFIEEGDDEYCGVRCWYRRIRQGHCGRGCDYYQFRLNHFPSGRFYADRPVRVVCAN
jgi:hypothetical protein